MNILDLIIRGFDWLLSLISRQSIKTMKVEDLRARPADNEPARVLSESLNATDSRATAVLQHLSIMVALCGILYSQPDSGSTIKFVFVTELFMYLLLTLCCLRLLVDRSTYVIFEGRDLEKEALWKEKILYLTVQCTFVTTIALAASVFIKAVWL